jgi:endogenous inhibitor of DNA gyrase (YacG/DUF329 family)
MAKDCPNCKSPNLNNAFQCDKCGYYFDDVAKCPHCGTYNLKTWNTCIKCSHKISYSQNNDNNKEKKHSHNKEEILFDCIVCHNKFSVNVTDNFNAFACKQCRSIFSYEWKKNKLVINIIKKEEIIPEKIKELAVFFDLEFPIEQEKLKKNYHKLISQYHPDKVSHLGKEFKDLSEQKTKTIIENYESLQNWMKNK